MSPLLAGPLEGWGGHFTRIAAMGFDHVLIAPPFQPARHASLWLSATHDALHPDLQWGGSAREGLAHIAQAAAAHGLAVLLDVVLDRVADGGALSQAPDSPFNRPDTTLDPRRFDPEGDAAHAALEGAAAINRLAAFWSDTLAQWAASGMAGVRLASLRGIPPALVRGVAQGRPAGITLMGNMQGVQRAELPGFEACGLDFVFSSMPWWDGASDWYWREDAALRRIAPVITCAEAPFAARTGEHEAARRLGSVQRGLNLSALLGSGWMMVMGAEYVATRRLDTRRDRPGDFHDQQAAAARDLSDTVCTLNATRAAHAALSACGEPRLLTGPGADVLMLLRPGAMDARAAGDPVLVAINMRADGSPAAVATTHVFANAGGYCPPPIMPGAPLEVPAHGARVLKLALRSFAQPPRHDLAQAARDAAKGARIAIEMVTPSVDGGMFPARFCLGEYVTVQADLICDGHDILAAEVRWRGPGETDGMWQRAPMRPVGNDRWEGGFPLTALGVHSFTVEAWKDVFATYRDELGKKVVAGLDVTLEIEEGRLMLKRLGASAPQIKPIVKALRDGANEAKAALLLSDTTATLMREADARAFATWVDPAFPVEAERTAARFASWYEVFPRSMSDDPLRHGTFDDVIRHLPRIQAMGFDVLYFPPIHPIGLANRKGRNNSLTAGAEDPGSPYGIADHTAVHPELGTLEDFGRLRHAALSHGLEIALDFAVQCSPDHPWLAQHKGWFDWRPDGSIRYAENPPKKYQDIVNVDFYKDDAIDGLWRELCMVVLFWCDQGVRIFRVDNPHTKPLPFWHWMIGEVRARFPDTMFLAEAFTKPKMMARLAKVGFTQSYTYFTWRNTKVELQEYLTELTTTSYREFFRPNFFVNTPDINPVFLQRSGRPGHLIRAALAATLAGLWGVYSGFELCEAAPLPGREEYLDSEKYQIRAWDWTRPGNIVPEVTQLNWIRRLNPALQTHLGITFLVSNNDQVLYFEKATVDRANVILVAINLDPFNVQESWYEVPLWRWELNDDAVLSVDDLVFEQRTRWTGKMQHVRLDPDRNPYAIWRVRPAEDAA